MQVFLVHFKTNKIVPASALLEASQASYTCTVVGITPSREQNALLFYPQNTTLDRVRARLKSLAILELCAVPPEHTQRLSITCKVTRVCGPLQEAGPRPTHATTMLLLLQMQQQHRDILALERRKGACGTFRDQRRILSLQSRVSTQAKMLINDGRRAAAAGGLHAPANEKSYIAFLKAENESLGREVHVLKEALDKYRQEVTWNEALVQECAKTDELHCTIDELRAEINGKDDENGDLLDQIDTLDCEVQQAIELLEEANIKVDDLQTEINAYYKPLGTHSGIVLRFLERVVARARSLPRMRAAAAQTIAFSRALLNRDNAKIDAAVTRAVQWSEAQHANKRHRTQ